MQNRGCGLRYGTDQRHGTCVVMEEGVVMGRVWCGGGCGVGEGCGDEGAYDDRQRGVVMGESVSLVIKVGAVVERGVMVDE